MTRDEMIEYMSNLVESTPEDASMYHRMNMLLSRMERLGMVPPNQYACTNEFRFEWEPKDD